MISTASTRKGGIKDIFSILGDSDSSFIKFLSLPERGIELENKAWVFYGCAFSFITKISLFLQ